MCLASLHCSGRMSRVGLPGFDIHCPGWFLVPLQPQDRSWQLSYSYLGPGSPLTWRPAANMDLNLPALMVYLSCASPLAPLAPPQCGQAQVQVATMCHGSSPLTSNQTGNPTAEGTASSWLYQALCSPLLNRLAHYWKAVSPQKWGRGSSCHLNSH